MNHFFISFKDVHINAKVKIDQYFQEFYPSDTDTFSDSNCFALLSSHKNNSLYSICKSSNQQYLLIGCIRLDNELEIQAIVHSPAYHSHEQLVIELFQQSGVIAFKKIIGDFSFVIYDIINKYVWAVKDHLGIRPLFYHQDDNGLLIGSTIGSILQSLPIHPKLNRDYIARELNDATQPVFETLFAGIYRLEGAHYLEYDIQQKTIIKNKYWELLPLSNLTEATTEDQWNKLNLLLEQAVYSRLKNNQKIGVQLSGGMDSSAIAVIASKQIDKKNLFSYSFILNEKTKSFSTNAVDEQTTQNTIIKHAGLLRDKHYQIEDFHYVDVYEEMNQSKKVMGGYANSDAIWQDSLFRKAGENQVEIMFSGFPGDECISNSSALFFTEYFYQLEWKILAKIFLRTPIKFLKWVYHFVRLNLLGNPLARFNKIKEKRNLLIKGYHFSKKENNNFFPFYPSFRKYLIKNVTRPHTSLRAESEGLYASQYGITTVYPLADIRLLEYVISLPMLFFDTQEYDRALFRNICKGILPESVRLQQKYNGAMTLAFAEYSKKKAIEELKNYQIKNHLQLIDTNNLSKLDDFEKTIIQVKLYKLDYLIEKAIMDGAK